MGNCLQKDVPYIEQNGASQAKRVDSITDDQKEKGWNDNIEKYMQDHKRRDNQVQKLLLLGAGSSGKSTIFKQLKRIYRNDGFSQTEISDSTFRIRYNCVMSMLTLLKRSQWLYDRDEEGNVDCHTDLSNKEVVGHIQIVLDNQSMDVLDELTEQSAAILAQSVSFLWALNEVKATFAKRQYFSFIENMDYFFRKIDEIFDMKYEPTLEDMLKCRAITTGLIEERFIINDIPFIIFDAGGQRSERRKWILMFEGVTAIIFVAALNHFCTVLFEDDRKNGMQESLDLFSEIVNAKWFRKTAMILFLNKKDIFEQRLEEGLTLSEAFPEEWNGPNYLQHDIDSEQKVDDEKWLKKCSESAAQFIGEKYCESNVKYPGKRIYIHVTTATDGTNIKQVFFDVHNMIMLGNLENAQVL